MSGDLALNQVPAPEGRALKKHQRRPAHFANGMKFFVVGLSGPPWWNSAHIAASRLVFIGGGGDRIGGIKRRPFVKFRLFKLRQCGPPEQVYDPTGFSDLITQEGIDI